MIHSVHGLYIGDLFLYEGNIFKVTSFPTRSMVCGDIVHILYDPAPQSIKVPMREVSIVFMESVKYHAEANRMLAGKIDNSGTSRI